MKPIRFLTATALASSALFAVSAFAQEAPAPAPSEEEKKAEDAPEQAIVVTGSRIARPTLESAVPITSVGPDELLTSGDQSLGDALNDLPSLRSTFSSQNSTRFIGTAGLNFLDLRGLGTTRTLVLVDGRRHVSAGAGGFSIDVNTIPFELLDRVDIVTGGNSAVYGSDAIAGVINFVLKKDFDGIEANAQGSISSRGDRGSYSASITGGKNFGDGRGNIAGSFEYSKISLLSNRDRPEQSGAFFGINGFTQTDDTSDEGPEGDGIPDLTFERNQRLAFISEGGTVSGFCLTPFFGTPPALQPAGCQTNGLNRLYRFNSQGRLVDAATPTRELRGVDDSTQLGGDGATLSENGTLFPALERFTGSVMGRYDVSDAFKPFFEFKFSRLKAAFTGSATFFNGSCNGADPDFGQIFGIAGVENNCSSAETSNAFIGYDNAFLNPADAATIRNLNNEFLDVFGIPPISQGFFINRNNEDFGGRGERLTRDTYRAVAGFGGTFNDDWKYEVAGTYGKLKGKGISTNNLVTQRFRNAVDSVRVGGNPVCRINVDANPNNNDAACVPINILGNGSPSQAALNYVLTNSISTEEVSQLDFTGFISGDSSQLFELPGGPVRFVLGGEYRREKSFSGFDAFTQSGATFLNAIPDFDPPTFAVKEAFAELQFPILKDTKLANELTVLLAGRISDYNSGAGATGTTKTYSAGLVYSPIPDLRFRANFARAVRAPTPGDLFTDQTQTFLFLDDPCDDENVNQGSSTRLANCRADGVPATYNQGSESDSVLQGGNPGLSAETSDSLTVGLVAQPSFAPGLTITVDYYDIKVKNLIAVLGANSILRNCYDAADLNNRFCDLINARQANGAFNATAALLVSTTNFAQLRAKGIDLDVSYQRSFDNGDRLDIRTVSTYVLNRTNFLDPDNPTVPDRIKSELGDPAFTANFSAAYQRGNLTVAYDLRYIGRQFIGEYEDYNSYNGNPPEDADLTAEVYYSDVFYHDVRFDYEVNNKFNIYAGVDNIGDRLPPGGLAGVGQGGGIYDNVGRTFYAGVRVNF
jgi:outer membrane receptor protein involved in Fe transport